MHLVALIPIKTDLAPVQQHPLGAVGKHIIDGLAIAGVRDHQHPLTAGN
jgi:hypothetical protein